jgi:hypothetical protein
MKKIIIPALILCGLLSACTNLRFKPADDMTKFYSDKLSCENLYTQGFNIWGNKVYGDIYVEGAARDCMLSKGYQPAPSQ